MLREKPPQGGPLGTAQPTQLLDETDGGLHLRRLSGARGLSGMEPPESFDEESVWGHVLRHKLAAKDDDLRALVFELSEGNAAAIGDASAETMSSFLRVACSLLRKEAWLQAEVGATFAGICGMFPEHIIAIVDKDWFVIAMLRMLRSPPDDEVLTGMVGVLHDVVAHSASTPESVAWLCTPAVTDLCMAIVTDPFRPACLKLVEMMMTAATELGPVALRSFVHHATTHENSRYFGETLLRTMNELDLDTDAALPVGYRPAVTVLGFMHAIPDSANFLFPADQKILIDVLLRHMACIPYQADANHQAAELDEVWLAWIATVGGICANSSQYIDGGLHKGYDILAALKTLREELPDGEAKKSATTRVDDLLPLLGQATKGGASYEGSGSGYGSKQ